jgi:uncharacterized damage-inducible protein DinB
MKKLLLMHALYTQQANKKVFDLLDAITPEERNKDRKSYFKSLTGLALHNIGSILFFHGLMRPVLPENKALDGTVDLRMPDGENLDAGGWTQLKEVARQADQATVDFVKSLSEDDLHKQLPIEWFGGNPATVPVHYLLNIAVVHGVHHRGQISQILDTMGIDNDFSGIDVGLLSVMQ